jgi:hypothetical protein
MSSHNAISIPLFCRMPRPRHLRRSGPGASSTLLFVVRSGLSQSFHIKRVAFMCLIATLLFLFSVPGKIRQVLFLLTRAEQPPVSAGTAIP